MDVSDDRQWSGRSRGGSFGYRFFIFAIRHLGLRFAYGFLTLVVIYFVPFAPKATSAIWFYNRNILGYGRLKAFLCLFTHYYRFGQTLIDKIAISSGMKDRFRFEFSNYERFLEILDSGRGVVLIGAHIGNWEAGSVFFGDYGARMNIVMYDAEYRRIKEALERGSQQRNFRVINVGGDGLENVLRIKKALDGGEYVCFQGDRFMDGENTVTARFMGREARFPAGPCLTASRMGVPVVFYYSMREKGRAYSFHFTEAPACAGDRRSHPEKELLERYVSVTEDMVRRYPRQWFNFYKFWS